MTYGPIGYTEGSGKAIASDTIAGQEFQRVKVAVGAEGSALDVSSGNPMPVTNAAIGAAADSAATTDTGTFSLIALIKRLNTKLGALGQQVMASSQPVVIASDQTAVPVVLSDTSTATTFGPVTSAGSLLFGADTALRFETVIQLSGNWTGTIVLQTSQDGTNFFNTQGISLNGDVTLLDAIRGPDVIVVPVTARYIRALTSNDFAGTVSGSYSLRMQPTVPTIQSNYIVGFDPTLSLTVGGIDQNGLPRNLAVNTSGQFLPADNATAFGRGWVNNQTVLMIDTTGYNSINVQVFGTFTATVTFQVSNDQTTWNAVAGWPVGGAAAPITTATAAGQWTFPCAGKWFRVQVTAFTSGVISAVSCLQNQTAFFPTSAPTIATNSSVNVAQIGATNVVTGGVAGIQAIGGNIAVGAAPTANPVPVGGWDGTNTRRILTDAVSGGVALGANAALNGLTSGTLVSAATNNLTQLKGSAGKLHTLIVGNTSATIQYVKLFFLPSASVTMGTTSAAMNFMVPASGSLVIQDPLGISNTGGTGLTIAITTGSALNDNTSTTAGAVILNYCFV